MVLRILLEFGAIVLVMVVVWRSSVRVVIILEGFVIGWKVVMMG